MALDDKFRAMKLTDSLLNELFDKLDVADAMSKHNRRKSDRFPYRKRDLRLEITHPGGGIIDCEVASRNLSSTGVSILYWNYLHVGTLCIVHLKRHLGGVEPVDASVMWCKHISGPHHLVGLRFANRIYPKLFVEPNLVESLDAEEPVDPKSIEGAVLHVDDQQVDRQLFQFMASKTSAKVLSVGTPSEAIEAIKQQVFNLAVLDLDLGVTTADKLIPQLRAAGYAGPILCVTAETAPARLARVVNAGALAVLQKPYTAQRLASFLHTVLAKSFVPPGERIFSEFAGSDEMDQLIDSYVSEVRSMLAKLKTEVSSDNFDSVRRMLSTIKGSASGYGFTALGSASQEAIKSLDATLSIAQSAFQLQQVEDLIQRICPGRPKAA